MRGSVVKRGKGYSVVLDLGDDPVTRKRRQKWHSGFATKREAQAALADLIGSVNSGTYVKRTKQTVADFTDEWLAAIAPTVRTATHYSYARNLRLHVLPYLGSTPMVAVDAGMLNGRMPGCSRTVARTSRAGDCRRDRCGTSTRSCTGSSRTR